MTVRLGERGEVEEGGKPERRSPVGSRQTPLKQPQSKERSGVVKHLVNSNVYKDKMWSHQFTVLQGVLIATITKYCAHYYCRESNLEETLLVLSCQGDLRSYAE